MNSRLTRAMAVASLASLGCMASPILTEPAPGPTERRVRAIMRPSRNSDSLSRLLKKARGR